MRTILGIALAAFWFGVGFHCTLEAVPGFEFLQCQEAQSPNPAAKGHCDDDACQIVEFGNYALSGQAGVSGIPAITVNRQLVGAAEILLPPVISGVVLDAVPPDLSSSWQFSLRAALPVRAPSFLA